jgi:hypothetical protein
MRFILKIMINIIIQYVKRIYIYIYIYIIKYFSFLVHFVVRAFNKGHEDNEAIKRFMTYNLEKHVREYPGQKIVILFDMSEAGIRHLVS